MSNAENIVYAALQAASSLGALVGNRIYPDVASQSAAPPLLVYERTASNPISTIHGGVPVAVQVTISVSAWAAARGLAETIADQVEVALRDVATVINRFGHFDEASSLRAEVVEFEVWET